VGVGSAFDALDPPLELAELALQLVDPLALLLVGLLELLDRVDLFVRPFDLRTEGLLHVRETLVRPELLDQERSSEPGARDDREHEHDGDDGDQYALPCRSLCLGHVALLSLLVEFVVQIVVLARLNDEPVVGTHEDTRLTDGEDNPPQQTAIHVPHFLGPHDDRGWEPVRPVL